MHLRTTRPAEGRKHWPINALSFYKSQNVLGWSKFLVPDQNFIYMLWQSKTFSARQKDDLHSVQLFFFSKVFEKALNAVKFLGWLKIFGPAQNILGPVKGQGIILMKKMNMLMNCQIKKYQNLVSRIVLMLET